MIDYYNKLPYHIYLKNERFKVNTDFRIFINFETEMQGTNTKEAIYNALSKFYPAFFVICQKKLLDEAIKKFIWFYKCGKEDNIISKKSNSNSKKNKSNI